MKVILLMNSLFTGGAEFSSLSFYGWLANRGYSIKVVVLKGTHGYDPTQFGLKEVQVLSGKGWWTRVKAFYKVIEDNKPQIVHSVLFEANLVGRLSRLFFRGRFKHLESLVNEMYSDKRYADPQVTPFKLNAYRALDFLTQLFGVDHYHANGNAVAFHYQKKLRISSKRITIIPRGRETNLLVGDKVNQEKVRRDLGTGERLLLMNVARHEYQKGQDILLNAVAFLKGEAISKIQLVIVGREGKLTNVLNQKIKEHHLEDTVVLTGHRTDVSSLLAAADVFIFPTRFEGLPGALIEAEAAGLPIVCSDIANNREVADETNAIFYPVKDSNDLSKAIDNLISDPDKRKSMGYRSLSIFSEKFTNENIHMRMEELLLALVK